MSSPDRGFSRRSLVAVALASALLAGCTTGGIRPLYGGGYGGETATPLASIDVVSTGRVGQQIRNELVFGFNGGAGEPDKPRWRLDVQSASVDTAVGVDRYTNLATAQLDQISATWVLTEIGTGRTVTSGTAFANAAYDYSQQRFANLRAKRDADNRAAAAIARDIRTKVAVWFAGHPAP